ncbi:metal ABC transporter permease [Weissella confusa]|uniref:Metal ABC transporter permease n=1 Tax=Weissella confusa TaxID=1583 RepID=A0A923SP79_WEICO|nr:metal ABC transporter permease [Weissella confusa]
MVIIVALRAVGVILVTALLITPAASARLVVKRFQPMIWLSSFFGLISAFVGLFLSYTFDWPSGPAITDILFGNILAVSSGDLISSLVIGLIVIAVVTTFYRELYLTTFDRSYAQAQGIRANLFRNILVVLITGIAIAALMGIPYYWGAGVFGLLAALVINFISEHTPLKTDAAIGLTFSTFFALGTIIMTAGHSTTKLVIITLYREVNMSALLNFFHALGEYTFLQNALIAGAMIGLIAGIIGAFSILQGTALIGDAMSHAVLPLWMRCVIYVMQARQSSLCIMT